MHPAQGLGFRCLHVSAPRTAEHQRVCSLSYDISDIGHFSASRHRKVNHGVQQLQRAGGGRTQHKGGRMQGVVKCSWGVLAQVIKLPYNNPKPLCQVPTGYRPATPTGAAYALAHLMSHNGRLAELPGTQHCLLLHARYILNRNLSRHMECHSVM